VAPGSGTYEIEDYTLTLRYDDGRVPSIAGACSAGSATAMSRHRLLLAGAAPFLVLSLLQTERSHHTEGGWSWSVGRAV